MKDFLYKIKLRWKFEWQYYPTDVWYAIRNFIRWFKTIAKDRDWDQHYFYDIIKFKLENMIRYWEREDIVRHVDMERDVCYMKTCVKLIDIVREDKYEMDAFDAIEKKWGESTTRWEKWIPPDDSEYVGEDLHQMFIDRPKVKTEEEIEQYNKEYNEVMEVAKKKHEKARKLLFNIFYNRLEHWWI